MKTALYVNLGIKWFPDIWDWFPIWLHPAECPFLPKPLTYWHWLRSVLMEHRGASVCRVHAITPKPSPSPGPWLLPTPHHLQRHIPATQCTSGWVQTTMKSLCRCCGHKAFYRILQLFSVVPEAAGLKVWRWNSCLFVPHASFWLLCCELYLILKPSSIKWIKQF